MKNVVLSGVENSQEIQQPLFLGNPWYSLPPKPFHLFSQQSSSSQLPGMPTSEKDVGV